MAARDDSESYGPRGRRPRLTVQSDSHRDCPAVEAPIRSSRGELTTMLLGTRQELTRRLLGVLVGLGLLIQPLVVPLHLALEEHTHPSATGVAGVTAPAHADAHHHPHTHHHPHAPADRPAGDDGEDGDSHPPHPADDHIGQQQNQHPAPPSLDFGPLAILPVDDFGGWDELFVARLLPCPAPVPPRPPPTRSAQPRAPPAIA